MPDWMWEVFWVLLCLLPCALWPSWDNDQWLSDDQCIWGRDDDDEDGLFSKGS